MKLVSRFALLALVLAGCAQPQTHADHPATKPAAADPPGAPAAGALGAKIDRSGSMEQQLARLQDAYDRNAEALDFLNRVYAQQKAQQAQDERDEPADDAMFAVDIAPDVKLGQVEGPASALVTIVEAWDFG